MSQPFVGEIKIFAGNFAPTGWAKCNGQLLAISQNTALFSLLGTQYGGDGRSTFALPNFQGSGPIHQGQGPGLTERVVGESGGQPDVSLISTEMPMHSHNPMTADGTGVGTLGAQNGVTWSGTLRGLPGLYSSDAPNTTMSPAALATAGSSLPHNNTAPVLAMTFIIALVGIFPPRG